MCCVILAILGSYLIIGLIGAFFVVKMLFSELKVTYEGPEDLANKQLAMLLVTLFWPVFLYELLTRKKKESL